MDSLEWILKERHVSKFWSHFTDFVTIKNQPKLNTEVAELVQGSLPTSLGELCKAKSWHEKCLKELVQLLESLRRAPIHVTSTNAGRDSDKSDDSCKCYLLSKFQTNITALILTSAPKFFPEVLNIYFENRLEEFSMAVRRHSQSLEGNQGDQMDIEALQEVMSNITEEDDEMESNSSHWRTSINPDDMDVSGSASPQNFCIKRSQAENDNDMEAVYDVAEINHTLGMDLAWPAILEISGENWVSNVGSVVRHLRELGLVAMCEEAYAFAVFKLVKSKILAVSDKRYERPVLSPIRQWLEAVPMRFLLMMLIFSSGWKSFSSSVTDANLTSSFFLKKHADAALAERIIRWRLRLQFFTYETLGDLRISELFDIIVDYPESLAAIEDLRECLTNTGDHAKLVNSFRAALRQRLLTAGAATTDILMQYMSTIRALRTMDPTGVILEAVGEPIREYLRLRKDTIRCIVTMLTDDASAGSAGGFVGLGESLFEELSKSAADTENGDSEDDGEMNNSEAWAAAERWEPDPVEADPSQTSKSRRSMDIISMLVGIYGSKELFVNEYRVMLADKLMNKSDYDTDRDIRTLELLKLRFGENNMHGCEIMLKDVADSKRINSNIKASFAASMNSVPTITAATEPQYNARVETDVPALPMPDNPAQQVFTSPGEVHALGRHSEADPVLGEHGAEQLSLEVFDATIVSSLFWPPFQVETIKVPDVVDHLLDDYAQRYHTIKAPRKLQWKKHLGVVKLELQFEDRSAQFVVAPLHASIILQFEEHPRWAASELASAVGIHETTLRRRIMLWVNQGVLVESHGSKEDEPFYEIVENMGDAANQSSRITQSISDIAVPLLGEEEGESAVASVEDQWQQEMTVYESYIIGMLTNFDSLPLDRIHNMLKMFVSDPPYDKTLQQLQVFLARLVGEEKLEIKDGVYRRKQQ
ncbi:hypothetical protein O6H91_15G086400 [Diphasiastrum complanatum]|nr:hypothetical protein O6H91_15G086400 [Diphasiastrum complanatum]